MAFMVKRDTEILAYVLDENAAWMYVQKHQGMSVDWAMQYEGWKVWPAPPAPDGSTHHMVRVENRDGAVMRCSYCERFLWELKADIGDPNVTDYQCPKAKA